MARPKKEQEKEPEQGDAQQTPAPLKTVEVDTYLYHDVYEPRVFRAGETAPDGWGTHPTSWRQDAVGKWIKD